MRYTGPVCRQCRREGTKLFLKGTKCFTEKCPVERRPYAPGQHGQTGGGRRKKGDEPPPNFIPGAAPVGETPREDDEGEEQAGRR